MNVIDASAVARLTHREAMRLQAGELQRSIELLETLSENEWRMQTECPAWDVRRMYLHVLGACEAGASIRENVHQLIAASKRRRRRGETLEVGLSTTQVGEREHLDPSALVDALKEVAPRTIRGRRRIPSVIRKFVRIPVDAPVVERWPLGYLIDTIYLRDLWMHRIDASLATGKALPLSEVHDGRIVSDIVAEWASRHGKPFTLDLGGPAGGLFSQQPGAADCEHVVIDAVDFCRTLAGRTQGSGLMTQIVPF